MQGRRTEEETGKAEAARDRRERRRPGLEGDASFIQPCFLAREARTITGRATAGLSVRTVNKIIQGPVEKGIRHDFSSRLDRSLSCLPRVLVPDSARCFAFWHRDR
jgi:hypothetical protein